MGWRDVDTPRGDRQKGGGSDRDDRALDGLGYNSSMKADPRPPVCTSTRRRCVAGNTVEYVGRV